MDKMMKSIISDKERNYVLQRTNGARKDDLITDHQFWKIKKHIDRDLSSSLRIIINSLISL